MSPELIHYCVCTVILRHITEEFHIGCIRCEYLFCSLIYYISLGRQFGICLND